MKISTKQLFQWIFLMVFVKMFHFIWNMIIIRKLEKNLYGEASVQIPFISSLVTKIIKETIHRYSVREFHEINKLSSNSLLSKEINSNNLIIVWWSIPFGIILSTILTILFIYWKNNLIYQNSWMLLGLLCWLFASWIELLLEPILIYSETHLKLNDHSILESTSLIITCFLSILGLYFLNINPTIILTSSHFIFTFILFLEYMISFLWWNNSSIKYLFPNSFKITKNMIYSLKGYFIQSIGKYDYDQIIMNLSASSEVQGMYNFTNNTGSIIARILFAPIERTSYILFTKYSENALERKKLWNTLLNTTICIVLLYFSTCPNYITFLLRTFYNESWVSCSNLLIYYGFYLLLMALNGMIESHRDAISHYERIQQQTLFLIISSFSYVIIGCLLTIYWGAYGLLFATCLSTLSRMIFNIIFFKKYLFSILGGIPTLDTFLFFGIIYITGRIAKFYFHDTWKLFYFGIIQGIFISLWLFIFQWKKWKHLQEKTLERIKKE